MSSRITPPWLSWQPAASGNTAASRSAARMRRSGGGVRLPPVKRSTASARVAFQRQRVSHIGDCSAACTSVSSTLAGRDEAEDRVEREAVLRADRQQDRVVGRRRLQLEVEGAAELLAQRQAPGAVDARAERRVDDELHAAGLVEEALGDDAASASAPRRAPRRLRPRTASACSAAPRSSLQSVDEQRQRRVDRHAPSSSARSSATSRDSSAVRASPSPFQKGTVGGSPARVLDAHDARPRRGGCATSASRAGRCRRPSTRWRSPRRACRPPPRSDPRRRGSRPCRGWRRPTSAPRCARRAARARAG